MESIYKFIVLQSSCMSPKEEEKYTKDFLQVLKKEWKLSKTQLERISLRSHLLTTSDICSYMNSSGIKCKQPVKQHTKPSIVGEIYCENHLKK